MLNTYLARVQKLLHDVTQTVYNPADLIEYINTARGQVAGEGNAIRVYGTLNTVIGQRVYAFSSITTNSGVKGVFNIRGATFNIGGGSTWIRPRSFPYFQLYYLNNPLPPSGMPFEYAQYGQGVTSGSLYLEPLPDNVYVLNLDCVCQPIDLVNDTTTETLPYPWTDAVPYFACFLALTSSQRDDQADRMLQLYETFAKRARAMVNGEVIPQQFPQHQDVTRANKLGISGGGQ